MDQPKLHRVARLLGGLAVLLVLAGSSVDSAVGATPMTDQWLPWPTTLKIRLGAPVDGEFLMYRGIGSDRFSGKRGGDDWEITPVENVDGEAIAFEAREVGAVAATPLPVEFWTNENEWTFATGAGGEVDAVLIDYSTDYTRADVLWLPIMWGAYGAFAVDVAIWPFAYAIRVLFSQSRRLLPA